MAWDFHSLFKAHAKDITRYLQRRGTSADLAADFTQDAFTRMMATPPGAQIDNASAYLFRIARNAAINHNRRQQIIPFVEDPEAALLELADEQPSPERIAICRQELRLLNAFFSELTPIQQQIFLLSRIEGRTFADIGKTLQIPQQTAYAHMTRILVRLKLRLDAQAA